MSNEPTPSPKKDAAIAKNTLRALRAARDGSGAPAESGSDAEEAVEPEPVAAEREVAEPEVAEPEVAEAEVAEAEVTEPEVVEPEVVGEADESEAEDAPVVTTKSPSLTKIDLPPSRTRSTSSKATSKASTTTRSKPTAPPRRRTSRVTLVTAVLAVLALAFAVIAGVVWYQAGHDSDRSLADTRDTVSLQSRLAIEAVNTSDYRHPSEALKKWLSVSSGSLHDQFEQSRADAVTLLAKAKIITTATVLDAAVTDLNPAKGTATVIASVNVRKKPIKGDAATTRNRFRASMTRSGGQWKLGNLMLVSVQLS